MRATRSCARSISPTSNWSAKRLWRPSGGGIPKFHGTVDSLELISSLRLNRRFRPRRTSRSHAPKKDLMNRVFLRISIISGVAGFVCLAPLCAQGAQYAGPGVARLSQVNGNVTVERGSSQTMVAATPNVPVFTGDYLASGSGSSAEVQLDSRSMVRSGENSQMRFVQLAPGQREMQLGQGTAELAMLRGASGRPQIDTPSLAVRGYGNGLYRVSVTPEGRTYVTVRSGRADIVTGRGVRTL